MVLPHPLPDDLVELIARRFRVIGESMRIRLRDGEATVGELSEALSASQQNISKHLAVLADVGILGRRKEGNHVYYRVVDEGVFALYEAVCGSVPQQLTSGDNGFRQTVSRVERILRANSHVRSVVPPHAGASISADGHTAVVMAGAKGDATAMVAAADQLKSKLSAAGGAAVSVSLTGASGMWSDFNSANRSAMLRSELFSWPVTLAILVLAFGSLVAAGLPLLLTILGLVASAGLLALLTHGFEISIWAMNFALMFALALGIDYALFVVHRFRGAFFGSKLDARDAVAVTMDTAGKAVLFSGLTVLISLSAVMLVPSPA